VSTRACTDTLVHSREERRGRTPVRRLSQSRRACVSAQWPSGAAAVSRTLPTMRRVARLPLRRGGHGGSGDLPTLAGACLSRTQAKTRDPYEVEHVLPA